MDMFHLTYPLETKSSPLPQVPNNPMTERLYLLRWVVDRRKWDVQRTSRELLLLRRARTWHFRTINQLHERERGAKILFLGLIIRGSCPHRRPAGRNGANKDRDGEHKVL